MVGLVTAACAVLSACSLLEAPPGAPPTTEVIAPVPPNFTAVTDNKYAKRLGSRYFTDTTRGLLVSPHFLARQQSIGVVTEIGGETAELLGLSEPVRAPEGHEFVVADFTQYTGYVHDVPASGKQPGSLPGAKYETYVHVGKEKRPVHSSLVGGKLLLVTAPLKARVRLEVNDSGRKQYLNLRNGLRTKDSLTRYYPGRNFGPTLPEERKGRRTGLTRNQIGVVVEIPRARAELSPFRPSGGWASRGRAWLYVTVQVSALCEHVACEIDLVPGRHVVLRTKSGRTPKAVGSSFSTVDKTKTRRTVTLAYEVPSSTRSASIRFTASGPLKVKAGGKTSKPDWWLTPKPITLPLSWR